LTELQVSWVVRAPERDLKQNERRIYSRVRRTLWDYEPLRASHAEIFIDVDGGAVRLRGRVRTLPQKIIAAALVERMSEVESVTNELIADPEIVRQVVDALAADTRTAPYVIRVESRHGVVTLRGEVPNEAALLAAGEITSSIASVGSVRNQLTTGGEVYPSVALSRPSAVADEPLPEAAITTRP
jgi:osmotically-inducible protein OsmY